MSQVLESSKTGFTARTPWAPVSDPANPAPIRKLSIIIPCYNEARTIALILDKIMEVQLIAGIAKEIIIGRSSQGPGRISRTSK